MVQQVFVRLGIRLGNPRCYRQGSGQWIRASTNNAGDDRSKYHATSGKSWGRDIVSGVRIMIKIVHPKKMTSSNQMEAFSALLALCVGNSPVTGEFPAKRPVTRSFVSMMFSFICAWMKCWVSNREAGNLRRYRAHCDVIVTKNDADGPHFVVVALFLSWWIYTHPSEIYVTTIG